AYGDWSSGGCPSGGEGDTLERIRPFVHSSAGACGGFFFSSRRRHTRCLSDWSSDVCSSDLPGALVATARGPNADRNESPGYRTRSEERRVGKECRARWGEWDPEKRCKGGYRTRLLASGATQGGGAPGGTSDARTGRRVCGSG